MLIWATEYCRSGNCLATAGHSGLPAPLPPQSTGTAGWQLPAQSHNLPLALGSPGTHSRHHSEPRKNHLWATRHTSGGTSYLLNHLQNRQRKHRQKKRKLNHCGIQCFSRQSLLWRTSRRGACLHMAMNCQRRAKCYTLCHILCPMPQSFPLWGLRIFWCLRVWGGTAKNNDLDSLEMKLTDGNRRSTVE